LTISALAFTETIVNTSAQTADKRISFICFSCVL
jgi:hypothetical protein